MPVFLALAAFQAVSSLQQGDIIRANAAISQRVANMNANADLLDAYNASKLGFTQSSRYQNVIDETIAKQRSGYAEQNVDVNYGTAAEKQADTQTTGLMNILDIQNAARNKAYGFTTQANNARLQGYLTAGQGQINASTTTGTGLFNSVNTGLSGYNKQATDYAGLKDNSGTTADVNEFMGM